jgi:hypothetical protein
MCFGIFLICVLDSILVFVASDTFMKSQYMTITPDPAPCPISNTIYLVLVAAGVLLSGRL